MFDSRILVDLSVVAGFRDRLGTHSPTTSLVAATAQLAGIDGVSFDLRGPLKKTIELDAKHVQNALSPWVQLVLSPTSDLLDLAFEIRPARVLIGPQQRDYTNHSPGLDLTMHKDGLRRQLVHLRESDFDVGVIIEPEPEQIKTLHRAECSLCVLSFDGYAQARQTTQRSFELNRLVEAHRLAKSLGMRTAVRGAIELAHCSVLSQIEGIDEVQIGGGFFGRALVVGVETAAETFRRALAAGPLSSLK